MHWYEKTGASALLRIAGAGILAIAYFAGVALRSRAVAAPISGDPFAYLLAAGMFLGASVGSGLVVLGSHIFDRVEVSRRWRPVDRT